MSSLLPFATALFLGAAHALEADHMAAVTAFAVRRPAPRSAALFGARWALGHGLVVVLAGTLLFVLGVQLLPEDSAWLDRIVGIVLIGLGAWTAWRASAMHAHEHRHNDGTTHAHLHVHPTSAATHAHAHDQPPAAHQHAHGVTLLGMLHGLAGTAPVLALLPITRVDSPLVAFAYLVLFAIGTALAMAVYAMFAGVIAGRAALQSELAARVTVRLAGVATMFVGVAWLLR